MITAWPRLLSRIRASGHLNFESASRLFVISIEDPSANTPACSDFLPPSTSFLLDLTLLSEASIKILAMIPRLELLPRMRHGDWVFQGSCAGQRESKSIPSNHGLMRKQSD